MSEDDIEYLRELGRRVARLRKSKGYSQDRLYLEAGFSRGTVSKIENGLVNPQVLTLRRIAKVIQVPLSAIVLSGGGMSTGEGRKKR